MATIKSYKSKGKTKYMFKVYLGTDPLTGKRIDTTRRGFSSAREAKQALTQLKAEFDSGKFKTKALLSVLRLIIDYGIRLELIEKDPFALVVYPKPLEKSTKVHSIENNFYSKDELKIFLDRAKKLPNPVYYPFFRLLAYSGIRAGEISALNWSDIDFDEHTLSITKTVSRGLRKNSNFITKPKTKKSTRTIFIDDETLQVLKTWKTTQAKMLLAKGINALSDSQLIFPIKI